MKVAMRIINLNYHREEDEGVVIDVYGKTPNGQSVTVRVHGFDPYFYIVSEKGITKTIQKELDQSKFVKKVEPVMLEVPGKGSQRCYKIIVSVPWCIPDIRNKVRDVCDEVLAADVLFTHRFLYDADMGSSIEIEGDVASDVVCGLYTTEIVLEANYPVQFKNVDPIYPPLTVLSFDLENSITGKNIFCICGAVRVGNGPIVDFRIADPDEKVTLQEFIETIQTWDPDVITGYNIEGYDIPLLTERCRANRLLPLPWGRDRAVARNQSRFWKSTGRIIADAWWFVKKEKAPKRESLNAVSKEFLGEAKEDVDPKKIDEEWRMNQAKVISYCFKDAELALRLLEFVKSVDKGMDLANVAMLPVDDTVNGRTSTMIDSILIRAADRSGVAVPMNRRGGDDEDGIEGGYVHSARPGLHDMVLVLDFKAMYPSVIISNNICVTTLDNSGVHQVPQEEINDEKVPKEKWRKIGFLASSVRRGLLPMILTNLGADRDKAKRAMKAAKTPSERDYFDRLQNAIKVLSNAFYGVFASDFYRFTNKNVGAAVTAFARANTKRIITALVSEGIDVLYGDTDSLFIASPFPTSIEQTQEMGEKLAVRFSQEGKSLDFEKVLNPFFSHGKKKRYVGLKVYPEPEKGKEAELVMRGYETRRTDSFDLQSDNMKQLFKLLMQKKVDEMLNMAKQIVRDTQVGKVPVEKLIISRGVGEENEYKNPESQAVVHVARKMRERGFPVISGMKVSYIVTDSSQTPQEAEPFLSGMPFDKLPDWGYYARRMATSLARVTDHYGWTEEELLTGRRQHTLDSGKWD